MGVGVLGDVVVSMSVAFVTFFGVGVLGDVAVSMSVAFAFLGVGVLGDVAVSTNVREVDGVCEWLASACAEGDCTEGIGDVCNSVMM